MKVIKILFFLFCIKSTLSNTRQDCLKLGVQKWIESKLNDAQLDPEEKAQRLKVFQSEGNLNQIDIFNKLISNFEVLPIDLRSSLEACDQNQDLLLQKCESFYGQDNCEKISNFIYAKKCPQDYIRMDLTKCKRNCDIKQQQFREKDENANKNFYIIDGNCSKYNQFFLDLVQKFESMEDCLKEHQHCEESQISSQFVQTCPLNFKKISFMCIPYCLEEINEDKRTQIQEHTDYCIADIINTGLPIFDF